MVYPVIMAGGIGTRFWPCSTPEKPKQFLNLLHPTQSMLEQTAARFSKIFGRDHIWIVSGQRFFSLLKGQALGVKKEHLLLEPMMRNTAPCIGWVAWLLFQKDPEALMAVVPSDHWIKGENALKADLKKAIRFVKKYPRALMTFGVRPEYPETGYGYIERRGEGKGRIFPVKRFVEKPVLSKAKRMIRSSHFLWNTGMFVWSARAILAEIKTHLPLLYKGLTQLNSKNIKSVYRDFPNISVDYGILEKSKNVYVMHSSFQWSDLGNWRTLFLKTNRSSKVKKWISINTKNCFVRPQDKQIATIGVSDLIIVDHPNGLLICHQKDSQQVREVSKYL